MKHETNKLRTKEDQELYESNILQKELERANRILKQSSEITGDPYTNTAIVVGSILIIGFIAIVVLSYLVITH